MPYIAGKDRVRLTSNNRWNLCQIKTAGELNYLLTIFFLGNSWHYDGQLENYIMLHVMSLFDNSNKKYQDHNDVIGALTACKLEFKRRFLSKHPRGEEVVNALDFCINEFYENYTAPYEDLKIKENGDVI